VDGVLDWVTRTDPWQASVNDPATRGGLSVAIIGEDGIRYYGSHLLDVAEGLDPGDGVEAGAPLGHVGRTGNARSTPPHLHFGISKPTTPDDWQVRRGEVNPYDALNAWREGRAFTPQVPDARESRCVPAFSPGDA
jgi:murein DD-endopeptidase MepM/ murein hydrolase activator NlpD